MLKRSCSTGQNQYESTEINQDAIKITLNAYGVQ